MKSLPLDSWTDTTVKVVLPGTAHPPVSSRVETVPAKTTPPQPIPDHWDNTIVAVRPPGSGLVFFVPGQFDFYLLVDSSLVAGYMAIGSGLVFTNAYFSTPAPTAGLSQAIDRFKAGLAPGQLAEKMKFDFRIDLSHAATRSFFNNGLLASSPGQATVENVDFTDGVLRLAIKSSWGPAGVFWIDWKTRTVLRSTIDGQEMEVVPGRQVARPTGQVERDESSAP